MAQDIRDLFKNESVKHIEMPENHEARFLERLETAFPEVERKPFKFNWLHIAASVAVLLGLSFGAYKFMDTPAVIETELATTETAKTRTLGDISPDLKKVEDYYLASINLELSKMKPTKANKAVFDGYLEQLDELNQEYKRLSLELNENISELTISALIDNLRFRLDLLYRLKEQLQTLDAADEPTAAKES